jgi:hypothetical protein
MSKSGLLRDVTRPRIWEKPKLDMTFLRPLSRAKLFGNVLNSLRFIDGPGIL